MPKSVNEGFTTFISRIQPLNSEHQKAQKHKSSVESCLKNNFDSYSFFETGSFGNGTAVRHYSDTDYFATIPTKKLSQNSGYSLKKVKEALQYTFPRTSGIAVNCPAVAVPFGIYSSETMEITPSYFVGTVETSLGKYAKYGLPNCKNGWMFSSPSAHNAYVNNQNNRFKGNKAKKLIQILKAWKAFNNVPIISFYLELRITKYIETKTSIVYSFDFLTILKHLLKINLAAMRDPMGISGLISATKSVSLQLTAISKLKTAINRAEKALAAEKKGKIDDAYYWWNLIFNKNFPAR